MPFGVLEKTPNEAALAARYIPRIAFDNLEPFLPEAVGYTIFYESGPSVSFARQIELPDDIAMVIEYAIWWDWDIQHLYELEHVWVYVAHNGDIRCVEGSWHGEYHELRHADGSLPLLDGRLTLYAEPGKHAMAASPQTFLEREGRIRTHCNAWMGVMGMHITPLFRDELACLRNPVNNWLVRRYLKQHTFQPTFSFDRIVDLAALPIVPWKQVERWIPRRVAWWMAYLYGTALLRMPAEVTMQPSAFNANVQSVLDHTVVDGVSGPPSFLMRWALGITTLAIGFYVEVKRYSWLFWQNAAILLRAMVRRKRAHQPFPEVMAEFRALAFGEAYFRPPKLEPVPVRKPYLMTLPRVNLRR